MLAPVKRGTHCRHPQRESLGAAAMELREIAVRDRFPKPPRKPNVLSRLENGGQARPVQAPLRTHNLATFAHKRARMRRARSAPPQVRFPLYPLRPSGRFQQSLHGPLLQVVGQIDDMLVGTKKTISSRCLGHSLTEEDLE